MKYEIRGDFNMFWDGEKFGPKADRKIYDGIGALPEKIIEDDEFTGEISTLENHSVGLIAGFYYCREIGETIAHIVCVSR